MVQNKNLQSCLFQKMHTGIFITYAVSAQTTDYFRSCNNFASAKFITNNRLKLNGLILRKFYMFSQKIIEAWGSSAAILWVGHTFLQDKLLLNWERENFFLNCYFFLRKSQHPPWMLGSIWNLNFKWSSLEEILSRLHLQQFLRKITFLTANNAFNTLT